MNNKKLAPPLLLIPILLIVTSFIILIIANLVLNPTFWMTPDTAPVTLTPVYITVLNGVFISIGGIGLLSLLPCLIAGGLLLTRKRVNT